MIGVDPRRLGPKAHAIAATWGALTGVCLVAVVVAAQNAVRRRGARLRRPAGVPVSPVHPFPSPLRPGPCAP